MNEPIDKIEKNIDRSWGHLQIYNFPLYPALFKILNSFGYLIEYTIQRTLTQHGFESRPAGMVHLRQALQCLAPELFEKCPNSKFDVKNISTMRAMSASFQASLDALVFSQRYDWLSYYFTGFRQQQLDCQVDGRLVKFLPKSSFNQSQSLIHHQIQILLDETTKASIPKKWPDNHSREEVVQLIQSTSERYVYEDLLKNIPQRLYEVIKYYRESTSSPPSVGENIKIAGYTVKECYHFWLCLSVLLSAYVECCKAKSLKNRKWFSSALVLCLTPSEIASLVSEYSGLNISSTQAITSDMILDFEHRPDVQIQPFIPILPSKHVYVSPLLFSTSNWEVCLLRRWAKKYPNEYGKLVASTKGSLCYQLASIINDEFNVKSVNKTIRNSAGNIMAEVDLAVFDKENNYLLISEIKWEIEADSFQEESHVEQDLKKGIEQLNRIRLLFLNEAHSVLSQLFPTGNVTPNNVNRVEYALISKGGIDCGPDADPKNIEILEFQLTLEHLKAHATEPFKTPFEGVVSLHHSMKQTVEKKSEYYPVDLAGYRFSIQGFAKWREQQTFQNRPEYYALNNLCYCGSGQKYRNCCQLIEFQHRKDSG